MQIRKPLYLNWLKILLAVLMAISTVAVFAQSDRDGDGFPDNNDSCPNRGNEGGLGTDDIGCPYYDADWDGVFDRNDACPRRADEYGFGVGANGCPLTAATNDNPSDQPPSDDNLGSEATAEMTPEITPEVTDDPFGSRDGERDADGDGFSDVDDACPWRGNEGGLGTDETGCPYYDNDWDGVFNRDDACPNRADEYGFGIDDSGCPLTAAPETTPDPEATVDPEMTPDPEVTVDPEMTPDPEATADPEMTEEPSNREGRDADGDGFPDEEDACPWRGNEGGLGTDETGCPYYDADWDGVFDRFDLCPWRADEYGFGIDDSGCPVREPESTPEVDPWSTAEVTPIVTPEMTPEATPEMTPEVTEEPEMADLTIEITDGSGQGDCDASSGSVLCVLTINYRVTNLSTVDITDPFEVVIDGSPMGDETIVINSLAAGASLDGSVELGPIDAWCYDPDCLMTATVDTTDAIDESNEANNEDTLFILG